MFVYQEGLLTAQMILKAQESFRYLMLFCCKLEKSTKPHLGFFDSKPIQIDQQNHLPYPNLKDIFLKGVELLCFIPFVIFSRVF